MQYLGLLLLLLGMGAFFGLWLMMINNRSKVVESQVALSDPGTEAGTPNRASGYSLAPKPTTTPVSATVDHVAAQSATRQDKPQYTTESPKIAEQAPIEIDDETAATHLEIAKQFFDMGDFEGAVDMCQLVIENQTASSAQKASANALKDRCE